MGGMVVQSYALLYPNDDGNLSSLDRTAPHPQMLSLTLACTYAAPSPFCTRMFSLWADMARAMDVAAVMRSVLLWAFTVPFFLTRGAELKEIEAAMEGLDMSTETYLAQLNVIQEFDSRGALGALKEERKALGALGEGRVCVFVGEEDVLIPVLLSRELEGLIVGAKWMATKGGHGCMWEFPGEFNAAYIGYLKGLGDQK